MLIDTLLGRAGRISQVLRMMVGVNISDEQLGSIADRTIQEADTNGDSSISFNEFIKVGVAAAAALIAANNPVTTSARRLVPFTSSQAKFKS